MIFKVHFQSQDFLSKCYDLRLVPETLKVKPPQNKACQNNTTWNNFVNLAKSTSVKNLKFAKKDVELALIAEETNFQDFLQKILAESNDEEEVQLSNFIKQSTTKIRQKEKEKYLKKLRYLKIKNNVPIDGRLLLVNSKGWVV